MKLWDLRNFKPMGGISWTGAVSKSDHSTLIYSAKYAGPRKEFIVAGGADANEVRVFNADTGRLLAVFDKLEKPVLSTDSSKDGSLLAIGSADGSVMVKNYVYS